MRDPGDGVTILPLGFDRPGGVRYRNPYSEKPVGIEETRMKLELERIEAEAVKLRTETRRMALSNILDTARLALTAIAAAAAVLVALHTVGLVGGA